MKKQRNQLIFLVVALAILAAGFFALKYYNKQQDENAKEAVSDVVFDVGAEDILKITYEYSGETNCFEKVDGTWYYAKDHSLDINQYNINSMAEKCAGLAATQTIEDVTDMSQYGLDTDARTIRFETAEESYTFKIGDNNTITDIYYICEPEDSTVYAVSSSIVTVFNYTLDDVVKDSVSSGDAEE